VTGAVVWITGLPASGKSTLAARLRDRLPSPAVVLDGDDLRPILEATGYDAAARDAFYRRLARLAAFLARQGLVVLVPATAHRAEHRALARELAPRFVEVWVRTPLETARARDPKGLYARADRGEAPALPGVGVAYEPPEVAEVTATGGLDDAAIGQVLEFLLPAAPPFSAPP